MFFLLGDKYVLKMRFVDHVYDDQIIEHMTLKVILPEGARWEFCDIEQNRCFQYFTIKVAGYVITITLQWQTKI